MSLTKYKVAEDKETEIFQFAKSCSSNQKNKSDEQTPNCKLHMEEGSVYSCLSPSSILKKNNNSIKVMKYFAFQNSQIK